MNYFNVSLLKRTIFFLLCTNFFLNETVALNTNSLQIDNSGNGVAVFSLLQSNGLNGIYATTYSNGTWTSPPTPLSDNSMDSNEPKLALSKTSGNAAVIWIATDSTGMSVIQAKQFYQGTWQPLATISEIDGSERPTNDYQIAIGEDNANTIIAIWSSLKNGSQKINSKVTPAGNNWEAASASISE